MRDVLKKFILNVIICSVKIDGRLDGQNQKNATWKKFVDNALVFCL